VQRRPRAPRQGPHRLGPARVHLSRGVGRRPSYGVRQGGAGRGGGSVICSDEVLEDGAVTKSGYYDMLAVTTATSSSAGRHSGPMRVQCGSTHRVKHRA
jgi:hypothetical protein